MAIRKEDHEELRIRYGLSYHIPYLFTGESSVGLSGEKVLEVGGCLPKGLVVTELEAKQWWAIEDFDYWNSLPEDGGGTRPDNPPAKLLTDVTAEDCGDPYQILLGKVEELPNVLEERFTRIFSIACFEHIHRLGLALERMHAALQPGGKLFTMFSPIWSGHDGHHIPDIKDADGRQWKKGKPPFPSWGHLAMSPPEMEEYLVGKLDRQTASELVYHIYHNPHINRLMTEDYIRYFQQSPFEVEKFLPSFSVTVSPEIQEQLEARNPGYRNFANRGIVAILRKTE